MLHGATAGALPGPQPVDLLLAGETPLPMSLTRAEVMDDMRAVFLDYKTTA